MATTASGAIERMPCAPESADDLAVDVEATSWGAARRVLAPVVVAGAPMSWRYPGETCWDRAWLAGSSSQTGRL